jgi:murein DD-endopeptidase MepM/ murein hydrolase activator NlpD
VSKIEDFSRSRLDPNKVQQELMGDDLDLDALLVYVRGKLKLDAVDRVIDINVDRTIEGASTVVVQLNDYEREILNSGYLNNPFDINIDGLWFRLCKVSRNPGDDILELTFEDREIAILRTFNKFKIARRTKVTRAEFILNLIREAFPDIKVVIPELHKIEPIEKAVDAPTWGQNTGKSSKAQTNANKQPGIPLDWNNNIINSSGSLPGKSGELQQHGLYVKTELADKSQIQMANIIIATGVSMGASRKVLVCAIMTAITESTLHNYSGGDADSVGLFQQRASWGSYADRHDPATASKLFYNPAIQYDKTYANVPYWLLCADIQRPREDLRQQYDKWHDEAERFVNAYGIVGGDAETSSAAANNSGWSPDGGSEFFYYRGDPQDGKVAWKHEDSWTCIQRLANEVNWRAFFVSGVFYYIRDDELFKTQPIAYITEDTDGVEGIGFDYDTGKKSAQVDLTARVGTWLAPPGAVIALQKQGPVSGRWLVNEFSRSLFDSKASITLKKPLPQLPEPLSSNLTDLPSWAPQPKTTASTDPAPSTNPFVGQYTPPVPVPPSLRDRNISSPEDHAKRALGNWQSDQAYDIKGDPGTPVFAVEAGTIVKVNNNHTFEHDGNIFGAQITLKGINGISWFYTHVENLAPLIIEGSKVEAGAQLGTITKWDSAPASSHVHLGCENRQALETVMDLG